MPSGWAQEAPKRPRDSLPARGSPVGGSVEAFAGGDGSAREELPFRAGLPSILEGAPMRRFCHTSSMGRTSGR